MAVKALASKLLEVIHGIELSSAFSTVALSSYKYMAYAEASPFLASGSVK